MEVIPFKTKAVRLNISFKPFNEHSHIVAIATTGNVFLAESAKGGVDLVNDVRFKKYVCYRCAVQYT